MEGNLENNRTSRSSAKIESAITTVPSGPANQIDKRDKEETGAGMGAENDWDAK